MNANDTVAIFVRCPRWLRDRIKATKRKNTLNKQMIRILVDHLKRESLEAECAGRSLGVERSSHLIAIALRQQAKRTSQPHLAPVYLRLAEHFEER